jgi:hypothetical protein
LTNHEKCRLPIHLPENIQHLSRKYGMGPIVERKGDDLLSGGDPMHQRTIGHDGNPPIIRVFISLDAF